MSTAMNRGYEYGYQMTDGEHQANPWQVMNVGNAERIASALAGGALVAIGLGKRSLFGMGMALIGGSLVYRGVTGHCMMYQMLGMNTAGFDNPAVGVRSQHGLKYEKHLIIDRSPEELYAFWRKLENLPQVMQHLISVKDEGGGRSHWVAKGPMGKQLEWDAEIINERPNELIAWRSIPGSQVDTAGSVHFERLPANRGTVIEVSLKYEPPGGKPIAILADWLGTGLEERLEEDLQRFKQLMESRPTSTIHSQSREPHKRFEMPGE